MNTAITAMLVKIPTHHLCPLGINNHTNSHIKSTMANMTTQYPNANRLIKSSGAIIEFPLLEKHISWFVYQTCFLMAATKLVKHRCR